MIGAAALIVAAPQDAMAQCTPTENFDNLNGANVDTNSSLSGGSANSQLTTLNIGAAGGDGSYGGDCVMFVDTGIFNTINVVNPAITAHTDAVVLNTASAGNEVDISAAIGGTATAVLDGDGNNTVNILNGADVMADILMNGGSDLVNFQGGTFSGGAGVNLGAGNDTAAVNIVAWALGGTPVIDGGADTDTFFATVDDGNTFIFVDGNFTNLHFLNFENLDKLGAGTLRLESDAGGDSFVTARAIVGTLGLAGTWTITGSAAVIAGARFEIGNGGDPTTVTTNGVTEIEGTFVVTANGIYNATGPTSLDNQANLEVEANGIYNANGGITGSAGTNRLIVAGTLNITGVANLGNGDDIVSLSTGGAINGTVNGGGNFDTIILTGTGTDSFDLSTVGPGLQFRSFELLTKDGTGTWGLTGAGSFEQVIVNDGVLRLQAGATLNVTSTASTTVNGGLLLVLGVYNEAGTTTVNGGVLRVNGAGDYNANGNVLVNGGVIDVDGGTFDAALLTTVTAGTLAVQGGTYNATGATLVNGGTLRVDSGDYNALSTTQITTGLIFVNGGTYTTTLGTQVTGGVLRVAAGTYQANGGVVVDGGTIEIDGGIFNAALTTTVTSGVLAVQGGTYNATGITIVQGGTLRVDSGTYASTNATEITSGLIIVNGGNYNAGDDVTDQTSVAGGTLRVNGGSYTAAGETNVTGGVLRVDSGTYQANAAVEVTSGTLVVFGGAFNAANTTRVNGGLLRVVNGAYTATGLTFVTLGTLRVDGGAFNASSIQVDGGLLDVNGGMITASGSTSVSAGTIAVQGGTFSTTSNTIVNGSGVLRVDSGTYTAQSQTNIGGNGIVLVNGGIYTAMGTTILQTAGAQLRVFGAGLYDASVSTIEVNMGTVLGTGTIGGVLNNNGGTVSPGGLPAPGDVGTLFLTGTYNQATGGNFAADLQPGGPADRLAVTGDAALLGNVQINTLAANFGVLEQFRIISTDNPIPSIFETATVTGAGVGANIVWIGRVDNAGVFNEADPSTGNNVDVIITTAPGALEGLTPNQQAVADYLGGFAMAGGVFIEDPTAYLITQIVAGGPNALDQIGGEVYDSFTAFSFNIARQYGGMLDQRVRMLRCAAARGPSVPFCGPGRTLLSQDTQQIADAGPGLDPGAAGTVSPNGFSPNTHPYGWSVWAQAIGSYLSKDRTTNNLGYSGWTGGGAIGVDLALSQRWIVGVLAGGTRSNIDFSGVSGDGDLEAVTVGVYTAWYGSRWFANAAFTYTKTWVEADRDLQFGTINSTAKGKTEGDQYAIHATVGYGFKLRKFSLEATGGVDWVQLRQYGFTETGAGGLNLTVGTRTDDSLRLRIGIRVARAWKVRPNLIISPSLRVGYAREVLDNTRPITSSLAGIGGSFTVNGDEGSRNILTYGGGIQADFSQGITLYFRHAGEWAGDRTGHTFNAGLKIRW